MRKRLVLLLSLAASGVASAFGAGPFTCTAKAGTTIQIPQEGYTELPADILLTCTGGTPTPIGKYVPSVNVTVFLGIPVTNTGANPPLLVIDDPQPANQFLAPVEPDVQFGSNFQFPPMGNGTGLNYALGMTPDLPNVFEGFQIYSSGFAFLGVPMDPNGGTRTLRITNFRANANAILENNNDPSEEGPIAATVIIGDLPQTPGVLFPTPPSPLSVSLGIPVQTLTTDIDSSAATHAVPLNLTLISTNPTLSANGPVSTLGFALPMGYSPDAGPFPLGSNIIAGVFDNNAWIGATFTNVPSSVSIFVSTGNVPGSNSDDRPGPRAASSGVQANLVSGGTAAGNTGLTQLTVTNGTANAVWEISGSTSAPSALNFKVYPAFNSGGTIQTAPPAPTNINVQMGYVSNANGLKFAPPSSPARTMFTINSATGQTPQLSATVDSRPCLVGAQYPDPTNACSPGNHPQITISSDSGTLVPAFSAATSGGVHIASTFDPGNTPINGTLAVTAPGAAAGTYQQTLNITAPGAANSLSLPYSVTVLPQNNPFIEPGGVVDAFSYAAGTIAPGQIFALFGANFGPSGLVLGTVNASGIVSTTISNTQVLFDNVAVPLLYVTKNQLAGVAPFEIKGKAATNVQVVYNGVKSPALPVTVAAAALSIASADASGGGGGVILNKDNSLNSAINPAAVGDTVVIYAGYAGPFANGVTGTDGRTTISAPYPVPAGLATVKIGGVTATSIPYFANAPTLLESVMQINVVIPAGVPSGSNIPVVLSAGGASSTQGITIAIK